MSDTTTTTVWKFKAGDKVKRINHPKWGIGIVRQLLGGVDMPCYVVDFPDAKATRWSWIPIEEDYLELYHAATSPSPDSTTTAKFKKGDRVTTPYGEGEITGETHYSVDDCIMMWRVFLDTSILPGRNILFSENTITHLPTRIPYIPITPVPEHRWIDNRIMELAKSIHDHIDRGHKVPRIWIEELTRHLETFNNR